MKAHALENRSIMSSDLGCRLARPHGNVCVDEVVETAKSVRLHLANTLPLLKWLVFPGH